jgi:hypothetical protein
VADRMTDRALDSLVKKFENLNIIDDNSLDELCEQFQVLTVNCTQEQQQIYMNKLSEIAVKLITKKRCVDHNSWRIAGKFVY